MSVCRVVVWARFVVWGRCGAAGCCLGSICCLGFVGVELLSGLDLLFGLRGCRVYVGLLSGVDFGLSVFELGWWCLDQGWGFWWGV